MITGRHVVRAAVYIDPNPVAAGMCRSPAEWRWSSYHANARLMQPSSWHRVDLLHQHLGADPLEAPDVYRELVVAEVERLHAANR